MWCRQVSEKQRRAFFPQSSIIIISDDEVQGQYRFTNLGTYLPFTELKIERETKL